MTQKVCCISINSVAHVDFGGNGFVQLASRLAQTADVIWFLSCGDSPANSRTEKKIKDYGISNIIKSEAKNSSKSESGTSTDKALVELLDENKFDLILLDRILKPVQKLLDQKNLKYCVVGTDGERWDRFYHRQTGLTFVSKHAKKNSVVKQDMWAQSSHMNINFFPKEYYASPLARSVSIISECPNSTREYILVTFGNSMPEQACWRLFNVIKQASSLSSLPYLLITGDRDFADDMITQASDIEGLKAVKWSDYEEAFSRAAIAIGHGGCAFVWYSIRYQVQMISIPLLADQLFNSRANERLKIGDTLLLNTRYAFVDRFHWQVLNLKNLIRKQSKLLKLNSYPALTYDEYSLESASKNLLQISQSTLN